MNILILNPILYTAQNYKIPKVDSIKDCLFYGIALGFKELGHTVTLVAAAEYKPSEVEKYDYTVVFIKSNFKRIFLPSVLPLQLGLFRFLIKEKRNFDLIISSEAFSFPSLFASLIVPQKTIIWHELAAHTQKMNKYPSIIWYNIVAKLIYRNIKIVPRSESAKQFVVKYVHNISAFTVEHGIDLKKFLFQKNKKKQFIIVSQLIPRKNIPSIMLKFQKFKADKNYADFKLLIVGRGELEEELKLLAINEGMAKDVKFLGFQRHSELNKLISESMALLIDTKQDGNMVSIPEAIVSGTPIITNLIPTNASMISEKMLGIAKAFWTDLDMKDIVTKNDFYVSNCINYRNELSTLNTAQNLIDAFIN